jgi:hypothetical protein
MYTFNQATEICLKSRSKNPSGRLIAANTRMRIQGITIVIRFHNTDIIMIEHGDIYTMMVDGFTTVTTKQRLNEVVPGYVFQKNHAWYCSNGGDPVKFFDGIKVDASGKVLNPKPKVDDGKADASNLKQLNKLIKRYTDEMVKQWDTLPEPSSGNCFFCQGMFGESDNVDHILSHLEELYLMKRTVYNMARETGYPSFWSGMVKVYLDSWFRKNKKALLKEFKEARGSKAA